MPKVCLSLVCCLGISAAFLLFPHTIPNPMHFYSNLREYTSDHMVYFLLHPCTHPLLWRVILTVSGICYIKGHSSFSWYLFVHEVRLLGSPASLGFHTIFNVTPLEICISALLYHLNPYLSLLGSKMCTTMTYSSETSSSLFFLSKIHCSSQLQEEKLFLLKT